MNESLLNYMRCPKCISELALKSEQRKKGEVEKGILLCKSCNSTYPIINFIPRFVGSDGYVSNFSFEWKIHKKTQLNANESEKSFYQKLGFSKERLQGKLVLDAGCGMGRYMDVALKAGAEVIGIDLSYAIDSAKENLDDNYKSHFIQADIFNLPFKAELFDVIYSIGVLHHTPNTKKAFENLVGFLKNDGLIGIWLYSNYNKLHTESSDLLRILSTRIPTRILYGLSILSVPLYYVYKIPVVGHLLRHLFPISMRKEVDWRILDTFDWYSPKYQWKHRYPEVFSWFRDNNIQVVHLGEPPVGMTGRKR